MDKEQVGRVAKFDKGDQYYPGGELKCCNPTVTFPDGDSGWQSLEDRGDVLVITPTELLDLIAESEARGAAPKKIEWEYSTDGDLYFYQSAPFVGYIEYGADWERYWYNHKPYDSLKLAKIAADEKLMEEIKGLTSLAQAYTDKIRGEGYTEGRQETLQRLCLQELGGIPEEDWPLLNSHYCQKLGRAIIRALKP